MNDTDSAAWSGWFRPRGGTWRRVVEAESESEAWGMILAFTEGSGDKCVLPAGRNPDNKTQVPAFGRAK